MTKDKENITFNYVYLRLPKKHYIKYLVYIIVFAFSLIANSVNGQEEGQSPHALCG